MPSRQISIPSDGKGTHVYFLHELSPLNLIPKDHCFIVLSKSYFDGGNEINGQDANGKPYKVVTLAAMSGLKDHWTPFEVAWRKIITKYRAQWLHTTDAVGLYEQYKGWTETKRDKFINECVSVLEKTAAISGVRVGIRAVSITVKLADFRRALLEQPSLGNPARICATQCTDCCLRYGNMIGGQQFELWFDKNEPYHGYIVDRWKHPRVKKDEPIWERVLTVAEVNMRLTPALQVADLLAWSVNHAIQEGVTFTWQERILNIDRDKEIFDYETLRYPLCKSIERIEGWKLPRRRPYK